ncbi:hypothetical protein D5F53_14860 [Paenibacillus lautus]|uniref:Uncharacterized protein n=1 Tax=Paenibacillus lautus TaxID=1401 RepID=A0A385TVI6_PAELA|nr:hypothetical protein D5F53_14860 [Paenibacillus lautus]
MICLTTFMCTSESARLPSN